MHGQVAQDRIADQRPSLVGMLLANGGRANRNSCRAVAAIGGIPGN